MTGIISAGLALAIALMRDSGVGRRISRLSGPALSGHLNSRSAISRVPIGHERRERFFSVPGQASAMHANRFQVRRARWRGSPVVAFPVVPGAHQGMLQDPGLVHVVAHVVEQALHQARRDAPAAHADRPGDHRLQLVARQARDQVLTLADRFGQGAEPVAVAEEVESAS